MSNLRGKMVFLFLFFYFVGTLSAEVSEQQLRMLEQLPPDQRASVMEKMEGVSELQEEIEETFDDQTSLIEKPELKNLEDEEEYCTECIYGYNFFQFAPSTFALANDTPVDASYILGPGDVLSVNFFEFDFNEP